MSAPDFDLARIAHLARLQLSPDELQRLGPQLSTILGYVAQLKTVDVTGLEPMAHAVPLQNVSRPDTAAESLSPAEALRNAPAQANGLFLVPKIVE